MTSDDLKALVGRAALDHVVPGSVVGIAVDIDNKQAWYLNNNVSRLGNPATGTTPYLLWAAAGLTLYPLTYLFGGGVNNRVRLVTSSTSFSPPSGFSVWG